MHFAFAWHLQGILPKLLIANSRSTNIFYDPAMPIIDMPTLLIFCGRFF